MDASSQSLRVDNVLARSSYHMYDIYYNVKSGGGGVTNFPSGAYLANLVWIYMKRLLRNVVMDPSGLTSICYVARLLTLPQQHRDNACSYATLYIELPHLGSPVSDYPQSNAIHRIEPFVNFSGSLFSFPFFLVRIAM